MKEVNILLLKCTLLYTFSIVFFFTRNYKKYLFLPQSLINFILKSLHFLTITIVMNNHRITKTWVLKIWRICFICDSHQVNSKKRNWVSATNSEFLISISLQPNVVDLVVDYEFCLTKWSKFEILNVYTIMLIRYRD